MKQTAKERKEAHTAMEDARQTAYVHMVESPPPETWSATMPAYCYTELCPDARYRAWNFVHVGET